MFSPNPNRMVQASGPSFNDTVGENRAFGRTTNYTDLIERGWFVQRSNFNFSRNICLSPGACDEYTQVCYSTLYKARIPWGDIFSGTLMWSCHLLCVHYSFCSVGVGRDRFGGLWSCQLPWCHGTTNIAECGCICMQLCTWVSWKYHINHTPSVA